MKRKNVFLLAAVLTCITIFGVLKYTSVYSISDNRADMESNIGQFLTRWNGGVKSVSLSCTTDIGNERFVLATFDNELALAELERGVNNKFAIYSAQYGTGVLRTEVINTKSGRHLMAYGKNENLKISSIRVNSNSKDFELKIPKEEYFISYCSVPSDTEIGVITEYRLFDTGNNDITMEIKKAETR